MFCIAAFIILAILGIFSARYRTLAKQAWRCVWKKVRFRPCDINFAEQMKGKLLGKLIVRRPRLARFLNRWIDWLALLFVILSLWSLLYVAVAGLNLFVYDTCNPKQAESCSLGGEACSIASSQLTFVQALRQFALISYTKQEFSNLGKTIALIPSRLKSWDPKEYLSPVPHYYRPFNPAKPTALEIIDPGCKFCAKLFGNIKQAGFEERYNLTYVVYPIADPHTSSGYKFSNSLVIASYLEASKDVQPQQPTSPVPPDWQILEKVFTGSDGQGKPWQEQFNLLFSHDQAKQVLEQFLVEAGYSPEQIKQIRGLADSQDIKDRLNKQRDIVERQVQTVKIPTILFGGRRYDRVVDVPTLAK